MPDPYSILGIPRHCSDQEIKSAYRRLALQWHPDRNKASNATAKFIEIQSAYESITKGTSYEYHRPTSTPPRQERRTARPRTTRRIDGNGRECTRCGIYKPWFHFERDRRTRYGHGPRCKDCLRKASS